ncbi:MAG: response regulator transcription factor [Ideonella sp.]|jgi:DNA-binding NarL/FixJ family response regulator|nr:response regulator transcription factor [Ideonella sp.]
MNLLLVDDHPLFGKGFVHALGHERAGSDVRAVLTLDEALEVAAGWPALDAVLIDYHLGGDDGLSCLRRFGERFPLVARVLISGDEDPAVAYRARVAGAAGFLGKSMPMAQLLEALDRLCRGGESFPDPAGRGRAAQDPGLTPRQQEVLSLVAVGRQNKQIAHDLAIAERTVKLHVTSLLALAGARNRTHLLVRARELGWL